MVDVVFGVLCKIKGKKVIAAIIRRIATKAFGLIVVMALLMSGKVAPHNTVTRIKNHVAFVEIFKITPKKYYYNYLGG